MPDNRQPINFDDIKIEPDIPKRTRTASTSKYKPITKTALRNMFETINGAMALAGHGSLALEDIELDHLADSWHEVIKMYPSFGRYVTQGNTLTVWGTALMTTFIVVERRRSVLAQNTAGATQSDSRNDGQRKDNVSSPFSVVS